MSDTHSYDENIEVQQEQETNFSSGGGGGGDDRVSLSSQGSSSHHHLNYHHSYGHNRGGGRYKGNRYYHSTSCSSKSDWTACIAAFSLTTLALLGIFIYYLSLQSNNSSSFSSKRQKSAAEETWSAPVLATPKVWSGDFSGAYRRADDGAWARDSASRYNPALTVVVSLERELYISKKDEEEVVNGSTNTTTTTTYTVQKVVGKGRGSSSSSSSIFFNFTSEVRFSQRTSRRDMRLVMSSYGDPEYQWKEVPTTITVETWAEGGRKGVWREVQHSSPVVKIKRIFFDDEMTAIYQTPSSSRIVDQWDIYVVRFGR